MLNPEVLRGYKPLQYVLNALIFPPLLVAATLHTRLISLLTPIVHKNSLDQKTKCVTFLPFFFSVLPAWLLLA
jgi:hypothetical protein